jgi:hypothetical protein
MDAETLEARANRAIKRIRKMTVDELEQEFIKYGYTPVRKPKYKKDNNNAKVE